MGKDSATKRRKGAVGRSKVKTGCLTCKYAAPRAISQEACLSIFFAGFDIRNVMRQSHLAHNAQRQAEPVIFSR